MKALLLLQRALSHPQHLSQEEEKNALSLNLTLRAIFCNLVDIKCTLIIYLCLSSMF